MRQMFLDQLDFTQPSDIADIASVLVSVDPSKLQDLLATASVEERLNKAVLLMRQELETMRVQSKIAK